MDKQTFIAILQAALWHFEGMPEPEIRSHFGSLMPLNVINIGIRLSEYLKSKQIGQQEALSKLKC